MELTTLHWNLGEKLMMMMQLKQYHDEGVIQSVTQTESQKVKNQDMKMNDQIQIVNEEGTQKGWEMAQMLSRNIS
jgi:hypothetical protein